MKTTQFKIEVDNEKKYIILKEIQNNYSDFVNNPMARKEEVFTIDEIVSEIFSEERNGFNCFVTEYFSDGKEIDYDSLKKAYDLFCLERTSIIDTSRWIGEEEGKKRSR